MRTHEDGNVIIIIIKEKDIYQESVKGVDEAVGAII